MLTPEQIAAAEAEARALQEAEALQAQLGTGPTPPAPAKKSTGTNGKKAAAPAKAPAPEPELGLTVEGVPGIRYYIGGQVLNAGDRYELTEADMANERLLEKTLAAIKTGQLVKV